MKRSKVILRIGTPAAVILITLGFWSSGVIGEMAKPISQDSSSIDSCEIMYMSPCGKDPIAVNERYTFLYNEPNGQLCEMSINPRDKIIENVKLEAGKCTIQRSLDDQCESRILNTYNSTSIESLRITGADKVTSLRELGACGRAYNRIHGP